MEFLQHKRKAILRFWEKKKKLVGKVERIKKGEWKTKENKKQKVASRKIRVQGRFISYEEAVRLLSDSKRLKELKIRKVPLK
jgi:hypothetical protein